MKVQCKVNVKNTEVHEVYKENCGLFERIYTVLIVLTF